jgi:hypothetical protein
MGVHAHEPTQEETDVSTTATGISEIQLVMIPSTDQDRSVAFYEASTG